MGDPIGYSHQRTFKIKVAKGKTRPHFALFKSSIILRDDKEEIELYWVQKKKVKKLKGEGSVTLTWSDEVLKYICQLQSRFTTYKLRNIATLQSSHSIRIYELLMKFNATGERVIYLNDFKSANWELATNTLILKTLISG